MSSKKELNDLDYAFKKAQLDLMLIEIEERQFRLAQEKKKAVDKDLEDFFKKLPKTNPTVTDRTWPIWQQPNVIPTPFTSEQRVTLGTTAKGAVVNAEVS